MNWNTDIADPRDGRSARWDHHRHERRRDLVRAARAAVHELGPQASMEEIAAHAGTSKSVFYRYFKDRAGLRHAVAERVTGHMERRVLEAAGASADAPGALLRMVEACFDVAAASPHVYTFAVAGDDASAEADGPVLMPFFERIAGVLEDGLGRELARRGDALDASSPTALWSGAAVGMVRAALESWLATPESSRPDLPSTARALTAWLLHGILGATATASPHPLASASPASSSLDPATLAASAPCSEALSTGAPS